jgi:hypothetical protein
MAIYSRTLPRGRTEARWESRNTVQKPAPHRHNVNSKEMGGVSTTLLGQRASFSAIDSVGQYTICPDSADTGKRRLGGQRQDGNSSNLTGRKALTRKVTMTAVTSEKNKYCPTRYRQFALLCEKRHLATYLAVTALQAVSDLSKPRATTAYTPICAKC